MSTRNIIHFSHANGFPAASYRKLFSYLTPHFEIGYINTIGHNPRYPVTDGWDKLVQELIDAIASRYSQPVIGVGHSLGGFLTFLAAIERPDLFKSIILLDSPIIGYTKSTLLQLSKKVGLVSRVTPGHTTRHRRRHWPSNEEAIAYFKSKALFKHFDPDCLQHYVEYGSVAGKNGISLLFDPEIEYQIFCTFPHHFPSYRNRLKIPAGFIGGKDSTVVDKADLAHMQRYFSMHLSQVEGGHLFPFEHPAAAAAQIRKLIDLLQ